MRSYRVSLVEKEKGGTCGYNNKAHTNGPTPCLSAMNQSMGLIAHGITAPSDFPAYWSSSGSSESSAMTANGWIVVKYTDVGVDATAGTFFFFLFAISASISVTWSTSRRDAVCSCLASIIT